MAEILKLASSIAGEITTIIALLAIILPKSRNAIVKWLKKALEIDRVNKTLDEQSKKNEEREKLIGDLKNTLDNHVKRYKEYTDRAQERDHQVALPVKDPFETFSVPRVWAVTVSTCI